MTINIRKFTKKPVTIEAVKLDTDDRHELVAIAEWCDSPYAVANPTPAARSIEIYTLKGVMEAKNGECWIIKGINGEFYPVRADIFEATYELTDQPLANAGSGRDPNDVDDINGFAEVIEWLQVGGSEDGFTVTAKQYVDSSRWYENWMVVITDGNVFWESTYKVPATETQEESGDGLPTSWVRVTQGEPLTWQWSKVADK